jgi:hypothetical protein
LPSKEVIKAKTQAYAHSATKIAGSHVHRAHNPTDRAKNVTGVLNAAKFRRAAKARYRQEKVPLNAIPCFFGTPKRDVDTGHDFNRFASIV